MPRYFISLSYNGTKYHGWQHQQNAATVQEILTRALSLLLPGEISLTGCGRTDTGVHARQFYAHFDIAGGMALDEMDHIAFRLNRFLPADIAIHWIREVPGDLHARFSAIERTYRYYIHTTRDPFLNDISWFVHDVPDPGLMNEGASLLKEFRDFTSFSKLHSAAKTNICLVTEAYWVRDGHRLIFTISADRFLRNMVRAVVGTLVDLGRKKITIQELVGIIEAKNRSDAGQSVPAHGLFLEKIRYPVDL